MPNGEASRDRHPGRFAPARRDIPRSLRSCPPGHSPVASLLPAGTDTPVASLLPAGTFPGRFAPARRGGLRCVVFAWFHPLLGGTNVTARGFRLVALSVVLGGTALLLSGCSWSEAVG